MERIRWVVLGCIFLIVLRNLMLFIFGIWKLLIKRLNGLCWVCFSVSVGEEKILILSLKDLLFIVYGVMCNRCCKDLRIFILLLMSMIWFMIFFVWYRVCKFVVWLIWVWLVGWWFFLLVDCFVLIISNCCDDWDFVIKFGLVEVVKCGLVVWWWFFCWFWLVIG